MFSLYVIGFRNKANISYTGLHIHGVGTIFVTIKALCVALCLILKNHKGTGSLRYTQNLRVDCVTAFRLRTVTESITMKLKLISHICPNYRAISLFSQQNKCCVVE
jgi:hypothetical protein